MKNHQRLIRIFFSLILFPHSFCYRAILILVTYFMKKRTVNLTDSTCPESTPGLYLVVHQPREKWKNLYLFLFFSFSKNASYARNMGKGMHFGVQKVLSKVNIQTAHSIHMENPKAHNGSLETCRSEVLFYQKK